MAKKQKSGKTAADAKGGKGGAKKVPRLFGKDKPVPEGYAGPGKAVALRGEVLPPETEAEALLRRGEDAGRLDAIKLCIERGIAATKKITVADTFTGVTIGMALRAAKELIRKGMYEKWVEAEFPGFSERQAQYYGKLADVFMRESGGALMLPPPSEYGSFLMRADTDSGQFAEAIKSFVGDCNMAELLDKYRIKPKKPKGGFRPGNYMVARYQAENPRLQNKPYEMWPDADKEAFRVWNEREIAADSGAQAIVAAEGVWKSIKQMLVEHGVKRESYAMLPKAQMEDIHEVLAQVAAKVRRAAKA